MKRLFVSIMVVMTAMGMMATDYGGRHVDMHTGDDAGVICMFVIFVVVLVIWGGLKR